MRILVVDDEEIMRRVIRRALGTAGHEAHTVTSPAAALGTDERFDAAIIDVHITPHDGLALAERLLREGRVGRVVFFTGSADRGTLRAAEKIGMVVHKGEDSLQDVVRALELG